MNKQILILLGALLFSGLFNSNAQIRYGIKGGLDRTNVRFYHAYSSSRYGFEVGGFAYIPLNQIETLYLQPELMYQQAGERNVGTYIHPEVYVNEKYYIDYIAVPVMLKAYFSDHYTTFFGEIGPEFAFKVSQKTSSNLSEPKAIDDYGVDGDKVNSFDFRIGLGLGFSYERQWELSVRYNFGLTDVYPETTGENRAKTNNNHIFAVTLNYIFE